MTNSNPNHGAKLAAGSALMPASAQACFPTTTQTQTQTQTLGTIFAKTSRARHKQRQPNKLHYGVIPGAGGRVLKSLVSSAEKFGFECPKVWFRVLESLVPSLTAWVEGKLENWLCLRINRDKTRVVNLNEEGAYLDFLGFRFRYVRDQFGRGHRYLRLEPSPKSLNRFRAKLKHMTGPAKGFTPILALINDLNRTLKGWQEYFQLGYPQPAFRKIGWYVRGRLIRHLRRRSQRPFRLPEGTSYDQYFAQLGLVPM